MYSASVQLGDAPSRQVVLCLEKPFGDDAAMDRKRSRLFEAANEVMHQALHDVLNFFVEKSDSLMFAAS